MNDRPTEEFIENHTDALPEFTPEGLRYVLPFYLRYSLEHPDSETGITVRDNLLFHLSTADSDSAYWRVRFVGYSESEQRALCAYFKYMQTQVAGQSFLNETVERALSLWRCSPGS